MEPLEYARYLVESPFVPGIGTVRSGFTSRLAPSVSSEQLFNIFSVETKISLLGKNETEDWIYVGFSDPQSVQGTQYAWVHRAGVSGDTTNLPILSEAQTDPTRIRLHDNGTVDD